VNKPPRLFVALYRAAIRAQPVSRRRKYGAEQMRVAEEIWAEERPTAGVAQVMWAVNLLGRALWAAVGSHLDVRRGVARDTQRIRESRRSLAAMRAVSSDARDALRTLRRTPAHTTAAVLVIALGIGPSIAMFSVVHAVLLKPLPFPESDHLVRLVTDRAGDPSKQRSATRVIGSLSVGELVALRGRTRTLAQVGVYTNSFKTLGQPDRAMRLEGWRVEPSVFDMLGTRPLLGRPFTTVEGLPGAGHVVVLSFGTWRDAFGGDRGILGHSISLDGESYAVVGVMPSTFNFPFELADPQFWVPLALSTDRADLRVSLPMLARVAPGVSIAAAAAEVNAILREQSSGDRYSLVRLRDELAAPIRPALLVLMAAAIFVLAVTCVNVANLCLVRAAGRERELTIRVALGAGLGRLRAQLLTEGLLLAFAGAIPGLGLAMGGTWLLRPLATTLSRMDVGSYSTFPRLNEVAVDSSAVGFALLVTVATGLVFGLVPTLRASGASAFGSLGRGAASPTSRLGSGSGNLARRLLVVLQVGVAIIVLVGGGLLVRSLVALATVPLGYDPSPVLTFEVATPAGRYRGEQIERFAEELVGRLHQLPNVQAAAFAPQLPMVRLLRDSVEVRRSAAPLSDGSSRQDDLRGVSDDYFQTMGVRVLQGRGFTANDRPGHTRAVVINRRLAREVFAGEDPIGQPVYLFDQTDPWQIVGVVDDVRQVSLDGAPQPQVFVDSRQWPGMAPGLAHLQYYAVRTSSDPESAVPLVRAVLHQVDPQAALYNVAPMATLVSNALSRPRLYATVTSAMSLVAMSVAAFGLYGTIGYLVVLRTREIAIRIALGARSAHVVGLVVGQSLALTGVGLLAGIAGAALLTRYLQGLLFGVTPLDLATIGTVTVLFVVVAAVATYVPARRAVRLDPISTLRGAD
jgi:putative ABC transport system permease protein